MPMKLKVLIIIVFAFVACKNENKPTELAKSDIKDEQEEQKHVEEKPVNLDLEVYDYAGLEPLLNLKDNKTHVINFWATWCGPCVKELPYFEAINAKYSEKDVEVILVSLDFPHMYESKLIPYIKDKGLQSRVVALNDDDANSWIPKVSKEWSGALPATIIYKNDKRKFFEQSFTYDELENELKHFLN